MKKKINMRPPFTYYGGKQNMVKIILPMIPPHTLYAEPFVGGGAVFFAKKPSKIEVLNDTNKELINFYSVLQNKYEALETMIKSTLHSRQMHSDAFIIYNYSHLFTDVQRAWALYVISNQSFSSIIGESWSWDVSLNTRNKAIINKKNSFDTHFKKRIENVQLEVCDALHLINTRDSKETFFYVDPPYYQADMGHYAGYKKADFEALLNVLGSIQGKFLLSSYSCDILKKYTEKNKWTSSEYTLLISAPLKRLNNKTEVLTCNYEYAKAPELVFNEEALNESIKKASHNLNKIKNLDDHINFLSCED